MARIPLMQPEVMDRLQREQYDRFPSNLSRTLLLAHPRLARALPETANALRASDLDATWREGIILRVAAQTRSAYEQMQHHDQARTVGWSDEQIAAIEAGDLEALPPDFARIITFVDGCIAGTEVGDDIFEAAHSVLSDQDIVTVILLVGHYMTVARLIGILDVELDEKPDSWTSEH